MWRTAGVCFPYRRSGGLTCLLRVEETDDVWAHYGADSTAGPLTVSFVGLLSRNETADVFTGTSVPPLSSHIWVGQPVEVRGEVEPQALSSPGERHPTDEDDEEQQIGKRGGEVDHLETNNKFFKKPDCSRVSSSTV